MLLMLAGGGFCRAQDVVLLENHQRIHVYNCRVNSGRIVYSDPSKAERELGWKTHRTIEDMCRDSWRFEKNRCV